jgi:hypothetical protein
MPEMFREVLLLYKSLYMNCLKEFLAIGKGAAGGAEGGCESHR